MPALSPTMKKGALAKWLVAEGGTASLCNLGKYGIDEMFPVINAT